MSGWKEEDRDGALWAVRYPTQTQAQMPGRRFREHTPSRWPAFGKGAGSEVGRRLLWLLFAIEIGLAVVAACVLPLLFLNLPIGEGGITGAIQHGTGHLWESPTQIVYLGLLLPAPILLLTLFLTTWGYRVLQKRSTRQGLLGKQ